MADSACLVHGFSHASSLPNESSIENPMDGLGESVSFGKFMTESLSWEKWSTFSHKKYVEEAERYAQPGSVAQKKAFFDAHFKRIAAAKKAAALADQQNAAKTIIQAEGPADDNNTNNVHEGQTEILNSHSINVDVKMDEVIIEEDEVEVDSRDGSVAAEETEEERGNAVISVNEASLEHLMNINPVKELDNLEKRDSVSASGTERPSLKQNSGGSEDVSFETSKERSDLSSQTQSGTWEVPSTPANPVTTAPHLSKENESDFARSTNKCSVDVKRPPLKTLRTLMSLLEIEKRTVVASINKTGNSETDNKTPQDCKASTDGGVVTYPRSENKRFLSYISSFSYILRREERSAKRKQKQEKKRDASEVQKMRKALKEKPENEFSKRGCGFCFKAHLSPDSYRERETSKHRMKKSAAAKPQSATLGQSISNEAQGTIPMAPPAKNLSKNKLLAKERIAHENASPNIQH